MKPYIQINCAMSADGKIAGEDRRQVTISSVEDKERVKQLRRDSDAILVGIGTVIADDPHLTVKDLDYDTNPIRIILDPKGSTPDSALVLDERAPTIIVTLKSCEREWDCEEIIRTGVETIDLKDLMEQLYEMGIDKLLVEGGGETISSFFRAGLVDRYTVFVGGLIIGGSKSPTPVDGEGWISDQGMSMVLERSERLGNGILMDFVCPP